MLNDDAGRSFYVGTWRASLTLLAGNRSVPILQIPISNVSKEVDSEKHTSTMSCERTVLCGLRSVTIIVEDLNSKRVVEQC